RERRRARGGAAYRDRPRRESLDRLLRIDPAAPVGRRRGAPGLLGEGSDGAARIPRRPDRPPRGERAREAVAPRDEPGGGTSGPAALQRPRLDRPRRG